MYLITEKGFHTFIKCNPTLLGYEYARKTMDDMGYDYIAFGDFHFKDDLQYEDAVPMLNRLIAVCQERNLEFGVKITNTFPVDVKQNELLNFFRRASVKCRDCNRITDITGNAFDIFCCHFLEQVNMLKKISLAVLENL